MTPGIRFFEPKPTFLAWAKANLRARVIYDVGAGDGHVARALKNQGLRVCALDLYPHEAAEVEILPVDATRFFYLEESVVMLCRPCHGDFVERVISRALEQNVQTLVYVGLRKNIDRDLGDYAPLFQEVLTNAGKKGEVVLIKRKESRAD